MRELYHVTSTQFCLWSPVDIESDLAGKPVFEIFGLLSRNVAKALQSVPPWSLPLCSPMGARSPIQTVSAGSLRVFERNWHRARTAPQSQGVRGLRCEDLTRPSHQRGQECNSGPWLLSAEPSLSYQRSPRSFPAALRRAECAPAKVSLVKTQEVHELNILQCRANHMTCTHSTRTMHAFISTLTNAHKCQRRADHFNAAYL